MVKLCPFQLQSKRQRVHENEPIGIKRQKAFGPTQVDVEKVTPAEVLTEIDSRTTLRT